MRIHLESQRLKERLIDDINQSGLPTMCARVVVEDLARKLRVNEDKALKMEAQAETREKKEKEEAAQQAIAENRNASQEESGNG